MKTNKSRGFTLVELLVVIAIIGILIGMLLPAVQQVRESARRTYCLNNMRQIGLATQLFIDATEAFPPARLSSDPIPWAPTTPVDYGPESWFVRILPYVEQKNLYDQWNLLAAYTDQAKGVVSTPVGTFLCSSRHTADNANAPDETIISGGGG